VVYEPGELRVVAYKAGKVWTNHRNAITGDGKDLSFVTATIADAAGGMAPRAMNEVQFEISGPGEIVATDNGDPTDMVPFPSKRRKAFNGLALVIVRARRGEKGRIVVTAKTEGLGEGRATIDSR
jgi:beta-galactosidase